MDFTNVYFMTIFTLIVWLVIKCYIDNYKVSTVELMDELLGHYNWPIIILTILGFLFMIAFFIYLGASVLRIFGLI